MQEQQANALFEQSVALLQQGKAQEALKILAKLDQAIPGNPGILYFTATGYSIAGNKHKAIQTYERVLRLNPQFIEAYNNIAIDLAHLGHHQKAIAFLDRALVIRPDFIEALDNKGCFLNSMGHHSAAYDCFEAALRISPRDATALANLSATLIQLGDYEQAKILTNQLLESNPNDYRGHSNLGKICARQEKYEDALEHFNKAHALNLKDLDTLSNIGSTHASLGNFALANKFFDMAIAINPDYGTTLLGLGLMHHDLGDFNKAVFYFNKKTTDKFRISAREYSRAISQLHLKNLATGWIDYAWRWKESGLPIPYLITSNPLWDGQITKEPVLIWHEQGIGDQILFGTLLAEAATRAPNLLIRLDQRLVPLFQRSFPKLRFISHDHPISDIDFKSHCPIGDLARIFRNKIDDFEHQPTSYLKADEIRSESLHAIVSQGNPIIGLAWVTKGKRSRERNLPIDEIVSAIQQTIASTLIDLQYSDTVGDRVRIAQTQGITIHRLDEIDNFKDIDGLAALISACDFVVTCSNSTAHLAGSLGKETYLLVPFSRGRHWYWSHIEKNDHSLWYPSIQVIPQIIAGDWIGPIATLQRCLNNRPKPA